VTTMTKNRSGGTTLLGIDVGTSGLKVILLDAAGATIDEATSGYAVRTPRPGWAEQDPDTWWEALRLALRILWDRGNDPSAIAAIGLTGQMHSLVLLDAEGRVLAPSILWSDQRTADECAEITERIGAQGLLDHVANPALPGFTAPKVLWARKHWPDALDRAAHILLPKDFIRQRLTGEIATDASDASGTLLFDVRNRRWSMDVVRELGIDPTMLPPVFEGNAITGSVHPAAAERCGLTAGTPVVAGGSDNAAAAVGLAAVDPGVLTLSIGTSGVIFAPLDRFPDAIDGRLHVFCHALPDRWHLMSVTLAAGGSLHWLREVLSPVLPAAGDAAYDWLMDRAAEAPAGSAGLVFLPYLTGERTPVVDPAARGVFFGLNTGHRLEHMVRSVLEGVAFSQRQGLDLMRRAGAATAVARGAGGGLSSPIWRQILADGLGVGLQLAGPGTGAARGAAVLAGLGVSMYGTPSVGAAWDDLPVQAPDPVGVAAMEGPYAIYEALYPALREVFQAVPR
jgi:xylulokinase